MRFHIPAIPHTITNQNYISCAYTQKVYKLCSMLSKLGHEVYHYGCEGSNPVCTENVAIITEEFRRAFYPTDYHTEQFRYNTNDKFHEVFYKNCIEEIKKRQAEKDFLLCAWGWGHEPIARCFDSTMLVVESGVGYESIFSKYRVFESYTWMAHVYGLNNIKNGNWYDAVIPNFFDPNDFTFSDQKEEWFLYLGRITQRKGIEVAVQTTKEIGAKLVIAGQGTLKNEQERIFITDSHVEHVGFADIEKRKTLLSKAKAVFMPTYYIEPFGGVSIEAALSGTPVVSSDWGVFGENILHGVTGYRCRTLDQFCWASENASKIDPKACRDWGVTNFSMDRVGLMYQEYFEILYDLWGKGWYSHSGGRIQLDWLNKQFPHPTLQTESIDRTKDTPVEPKKQLFKIAIWTQTDWAFGRISENVKRIFKDIYQVGVFDWSLKYGPEQFQQFDLIYVPTWPDRMEFLKRYPLLDGNRVICGIHGVAELFYFDHRTGKRNALNIDELNTFKVSEEVISQLQSIPCIGVVNKRLFNLLNDKLRLNNIFLTECGVDITEFKFSDSFSEKAPLRVLYPIKLPQDSHTTHGYDAKRFQLIKKIQETFHKEHPDLEFIIPDEIIPNKKMSEFYNKGDIHLCLSHTEGGPLVALESAACGLIQVSTRVGVVPDIVENGLSGYLIDEEKEEKILEKVNYYLKDLRNNRHKISEMKKRNRQIIERDWTWESKKSQWKFFFDSALKNCKTKCYSKSTN